MASSSYSSSSNPPQWIHDVFLNFRGEDTRTNFVSHLDAALTNAGINTYIDQQLHKGTELEPELSQAIEGSHISIVVLSKRYTESSWCLNELKKIMECHKTHGQVVVPIFYDVDPSVVRQQKGAFGQVLRAVAKKLYLDSGEERMESVLSRWTSALTRAANLSGWDVTNCRSEAELVQQIVEDVLAKLNSTSLSITEYPVGLESRVQKVIDFIENQLQKVSVIGIWGMGGSGKTTTAKVIYNQIHRKFVHRSFVENVREVCEKENRGIIHLQQQLLSDILNTKEKIHSTASGTTKIKKRFQGKKVLLVLDDVTTFEQLKALYGNPKMFSPGSVLIVTTRDARLLKLVKVDYVCIMKEMDEMESLELFNWHAFRQPSPVKGFSKFSRNVVAYCGGLPLALEVIGSYLYERTEEEWKSVLLKLQRIPNDQVQEKLRISYDGLNDDMYKDIFLDICCFFIGNNRAYVTEILNGCGLYADIGIAVLVDRSLLKVEKNNKLGVHDLIRDMGREIVRESSAKRPGKRTRLWFHQDVHDILTKNSLSAENCRILDQRLRVSLRCTGTETVEGLVLKSQRTGRVCFSANSFKEMKNLRLLQLDCVDLTGDYGYLSKELKWVRWQRSTFNSIPNNFYLGNLVVIDLKYSNIRQVWNDTELLGNLKILNLSHSKYLTCTPEFSKSPNLEKLIMKDCPNLSEVHQSIGDLNNLLLINLKDCTSLNNLPKKIYKLKSLKTLILSGCSKIDRLEEDIVQMESLTTLIAKDTAIKENNNIGILSPMVRSPSQLRIVWVQCRSKIQITQELRRILDDQYDVNFTKSETSHAPQTSNLSLRSLLIGMGSCHPVIDTLGKSILQGLTSKESSDLFLPSGNHPSWLAYRGEGPSAQFLVPGDIGCDMKGIILCVVYSSTSENIGAECLISVLIVNYTRFTIQIYKRDTLMSLNDEDWKIAISNLGPGEDVEIFVVFGHGLIVKETAVYLIYGQSITMEVESSTNTEMEPSAELNTQPSPEVDVQPSPNVKVEESTIVKIDLSPAVKAQSSSTMEMKPLPKLTKSIFPRLGKRIGACLCLNQHREKV
ncbi:hypothetical protein TSUD_354750 [Trifolium subterraneum]|uniref:TIR domain-containing protein n=1 Tax=Trifolium subterraneum TaxID=3900 RepID=A0A2Z6MXM4_TRISU|nr:hypothetical protein TSUD_354750 [Trifolium subterraneum]